ncbi:MAG: serine/threonine-protein kinase, partial [Acidobacteriota bacterium]
MLDKRALEIAAEAREVPVEEREAFVHESCGSNKELQDRVEVLIEVDTSHVGFLDGSIAEALLVDTLQKGQRVGAFRVERLIERGGMGEVYLASRIEGDFAQKVAIKVVQLATKNQLYRFQTERRALAKLDHPSIARILDGGRTEDGTPYFAMEYVEGMPINNYCHEHNLPVKDRLALFVKICAAVQFAHQNLVVHRDLKPSNILITDDGAPKLLDFGVAKLLDPDNESTVSLAALPGFTPEYASPEQVMGESITTASDVYSLGVLLYELLAGQRPYSLDGRSAESIQKIICEVDPPRPSAVASQKNLDRKALRQIKGDLDNIALAGLRKEPEARYQSARELKDDVVR